jgi:putative nucleotidyltransferase with HDIG domain
MWTLTTNKNWGDVRDQFDWVRDMEGVVQDPVHHAEGDVAVHTRMVLEALEQSEDYHLLPVQDQEILWAAALLHDVEKRSTTVTEVGSITAKGHAKKGAMSSRLILYAQQPTPFFIREQVVNLVRYHGLPLWALEKKDPVQSVIATSLLVDTSRLATLAKADVLGRICNDKEELLYRIGLFETLCQECGCWGQPRRFQTNHARFHYVNKERVFPDFVPYDDFGSTVILLSGLPGAGKDTYVQQHYKDWPVINLDSIRQKHHISPTDKSGNGKVVQMAKEQAREYLRQQRPFVWNATNITKQMRSQLVDLFVTYKAYVKIAYIEVPFNRLHQQNKNRDAVLPYQVINRLVSKLEVPLPWEAHEVVYHIKN